MVPVRALKDSVVTFKLFLMNTIFLGPESQRAREPESQRAEAAQIPVDFEVNGQHDEETITDGSVGLLVGTIQVSGMATNDSS